MSDRITPNDLRGMVKRATRNLEDVGIIAPNQAVALERGSRTNGNAYRLVTFGIEDARRSEPFGTFHFGFTARDAYDRLHAVCVGMETAMDAKRV